MDFWNWLNGLGNQPFGRQGNQQQNFGGGAQASPNQLAGYLPNDSQVLGAINPAYGLYQQFQNQFGPNAGYSDMYHAPAPQPAGSYTPYGPHEDQGNSMSGDVSQAYAANPGGTPANTNTNGMDPAYLAMLQQQQLAATQYQQEQMDLANRRFAWEQQQAQQAAELKKQADESGASDNWNKMVLDYMSKNPLTGANVAAGFFAPAGQANSRAMVPNALLTDYYAQHPELGPAPGTGPHLAGYTGSASVGSDQMQSVASPNTPGQQAGAATPGTMGININDFLYGARTPDGTPVPLGPQQEAQLGNRSGSDYNAWQDYVGNYAGFDPSQLLGDSVGNFGSALKDPSNFTG